MKITKWLGLIAVLMLASWVQADNVAIPVGQQTVNADGERPRAGMTKEGVEQKFGAPIQRRGPVGDPPISSWDYGDYVVYFEHNTVLHSVVKHRPRNGSN